ncbi:putative J domain-containing protein C2E1P5.03 [Psilocybe cubensis]|uniref:J domain-containing protein C2E1P5.03 n=2 Tax=Psilocybe cubensis TaxID=181762 RepID=A0ACB8H4S9_PSICU|nr:putative J domain-containing protein C2E1P5.03 [Psilocybe cubensis]KAH9482729.1 putative J domain-containing protein C2E1P5.03 [Psilocybe cubensis]
MRPFTVWFALLAFLVASVAAWEKEDHEIFDIVSELEAAEGKGTTFYSWLDVPPTASTNDIAKAYRKKSMLLHPDKNPDVKGVHERFARLGVISTILRNKESRKRYDFFYKNGVPKWRGTGYYYSRFRPGLGSVIIFLTVLTSALQFVIQGINYRKDLERIELIVSQAKAAAWGPKMVPVAGQRKVRVNLGESRDEDGEVTGKRWLDMVVEDSCVYLLEPNGDMHLIDASTAVKPSIANTWFIVLLRSLLNKLTGGRLLDKATAVPAPVGENGSAPDIDTDASSTTGSEAPSGYSTPKNGEEKVRIGGPTSKAGGMRRKNVRKRA